MEFSSRKSLRPFFRPVMRLMNEGYRDIYGFVPLDEAEINHLADQYLGFIDPALVKMVINELQEPVAFVIAMPNISKALRRSKGRLFPFGLIRILVEMKQSTQLDLLPGAIAPSYRGRGLNVMMGIALLKTAGIKGMKYTDSHLILEENRLMRAEMEKLGGAICKRYRIYIKQWQQANL